MPIIRKNQIFTQEYRVCKYINGEFMGTMSGMGRNKGTWDANANSKRTAQRWAKLCRQDDPKGVYCVETSN